MCQCIIICISVSGFYVGGESLQGSLDAPEGELLIAQSLKMANEEVTSMCGTSEEFQSRISYLEELSKAQNSRPGKRCLLYITL